MQQAAILWHVSLLVPPHRRGLALGIVGLVRVGPIVVFSLLSGVVADALDRRRLMMATQVSAALVAAALAALAFSGVSRGVAGVPAGRARRRRRAPSTARRARRSFRPWCRASISPTRSA